MDFLVFIVPPQIRRMADENDFAERGPNHTMITLPFDNSDGELPYVTPKGAREARFVSPLSELSFEANLCLLKTLSLLDRPHVLLAAYCRQVGSVHLGFQKLSYARIFLLLSEKYYG